MVRQALRVKYLFAWQKIVDNIEIYLVIRRHINETNIHVKMKISQPNVLKQHRWWLAESHKNIILRERIILYIYK